ncbi:protein of unknown function (plasmid) [Cupriavidus taiwanensis]|uniref:Uncharacterized protein n=1 Tax=Cupriavidus taiwanensis TaxID=164546 RepID=A0A7Z7JCY6_9BURK|nr:protein of unknown function [Cupriavidus taiwanensis]SOZ13097.1 protein of unknown function [Cupriavidus taiwanensis]SOZ41643.1 protein of unknown function [Cupriavidus taiwanensis]SPC21005.1 protein of unknown function [Cupriavidus taiwanensis]SPD55147.1 protein of unknown function [Cupriavidus taiwanensis]
MGRPGRAAGARVARGGTGRGAGRRTCRQCARAGHAGGNARISGFGQRRFAASYNRLKMGTLKSRGYKANKSARGPKHLDRQFASIIQEHKLCMTRS